MSETCSDWRINRCVGCNRLGKITLGETYCASCKKQLKELDQ